MPAEPAPATAASPALTQCLIPVLVTRSAFDDSLEVRIAGADGRPQTMTCPDAAFLHPPGVRIDFEPEQTPCKLRAELLQTAAGAHQARLPWGIEVRVPVAFLSDGAGGWSRMDARYGGATRVVNLRTHPYDVYIGRAGHGLDGYFGNPFPRLEGEAKGSTLDKFRAYFLRRLEQDLEFLSRVRALRGRTLGCFCDEGDLCHGQIIARWIDADAHGRGGK